MCAITLSACGLSEEEVGAISQAVAADMAAEDTKRAVKDAQDFDQIAQETVDGMDTSGLGALTE